MFSFTRSRPVLGAVVIAAVAVGCTDHAAITPPSRSLTASALASRVAVPISGRHIFVLNGAIPKDFESRVRAKGGSVVATHDQVQLVVTEGLNDDDAAALAGGGQVARDVTARWAPTPEEMRLSAANATISADASAPTPLAAAPTITELWNMEQIHAPEVWPTKTASPSVKVAILDSGLDPLHPLMAGVVDAADSRSFVGTDMNCKSSNNWVDDFFHGTFVGGIVGGRSAFVQLAANSFLHFSGVAPRAQLVAVKVLNSEGEGTFTELICGLIYASSQLHAPVINMSLGATFEDNKDTRALQAALARVFQFVKGQGSTVISAAGNDTADIGVPHGFVSLPCEAGPQICVSATTADDRLASYSNFGRTAVDVAAPGGDVADLPKDATQADAFAKTIFGICSRFAPACYFTDKDGVVHYSLFVFADGTSASAPHVSGLAALLISQPTNARLVPEAVMATIRRNADAVGNKSQFGDGRINVARTLGVEHNGRAIGLR
jgi:subtilisin family serine protease